MIGWALASALTMDGSPTSVGSLLRIWAMRRSTSIAAWFTSASSTNWMLTLALPSDEVDEMVLTPARPATAFSAGLATRSSTSLGEAPGYGIETNTAGKLIA